MYIDMYIYVHVFILWSHIPNTAIVSYVYIYIYRENLGTYSGAYTMGMRAKRPDKVVYVCIYTCIYVHMYIRIQVCVCVDI